jgi:dipeptidyl aminopeptidase/acylaminoacyl peptidase
MSSFRLSPEGRHLLLTHSTTQQPPELYLQEARPDATARQITATTSQAFKSRQWTRPEIVEVRSSHQPRPIYSRLYQPDSQAPPAAADGRRPAVVFVHGAGYLQNSHLGWSGYFREFMFHTLLNRAGYVVLDMDYRASRGYGRDWRTAIYRQMGTPELQDLQDGVRYLVAEQGVDPERVGVYGGSYGGFMTFMALFRDPELFAAGAALRPVSDWAHYNHSYTSNILNSPEIDPEAYAASSPIEFAAGLKHPLLICAPMVDDNVFFQDTVRLVQVLIELEKEDWQVALYPVEAHGFRQPSSWLDEYRRIFKLFETYLQ